MRPAWDQTHDLDLQLDSLPIALQAWYESQMTRGIANLDPRGMSGRMYVGDN